MVAKDEWSLTNKLCSKVGHILYFTTESKSTRNLQRSKVDPERTKSINNNNNICDNSDNDKHGLEAEVTTTKDINDNCCKNNNNSKSIDKMNAILLTTVFLLGVFSAILFCLITTMDNSRRTLFQPLPQVEHLQIRPDSLDIFQQDTIDYDGECNGDNPLGFELEAVGALKLALEMKEQGKISKAQKLFKHAMAICPKHPDILTNYGEFFEDSRGDLLMADHFYVQALTYSPFHSKALSNRKRTEKAVDELDDRRLKRIDEKRDILIKLSDGSAALRRVKKEAYFQHIFHTVGIEGNTMTLSETRMILETNLAVGGKSILEHNEILGLDAAMKFINTSLVHRIGLISLDDILAIHYHLMGYADPSNAGKLRMTQVYVGSHIPPSPSILDKQLAQLIDWLNSDEALSLHPIHYAALAHYKLVYIHPFEDGNGRSSRLLMNWILMQAGFPPVIIRRQDRALYYEHLNTANRGDLRPFIRFIADATEKTVDVYLWATRELGHYRHIISDESQSNDEKKTNIREIKEEMETVESFISNEERGGIEDSIEEPEEV